MIVDIARIEAELQAKLPLEHYGFLPYVKHGAVVPGMGVIAPTWCADLNYGDCDVFANAVIEHLMASAPGCRPQVLLINLPYHDPLAGDSKELQHTMVFQGNWLQGDLYWWGYTPYDHIVTGRTGFLDINRLTFPLVMREQIDAEEFLGRFAGKLAKCFAFINADGLLEVTQVEHPDDSLPVVVQRELCEVGGPACYDAESNVCTDFSARAGVNTDGPIVGFQHRMYRDVLDGGLKPEAFADWFFVLQLDDLAHLQDVVRQWQPQETLSRLLKARLPDVEARLHGDFNIQLLEPNIEAGGEPLYWLIVNSATPTGDPREGLERIRLSTPPAG